MKFKIISTIIVIVLLVILTVLFAPRNASSEDTDSNQIEMQP